MVVLTAQDLDLLERACAEDETPAVVEAICSCKSSADVCRVVQDRLLLGADKRPAAFGFGLARGLRRLRTGGQNTDNSDSNEDHDDDDDDDGGGGVHGISAGGTRRRHLLRASASCVSKALQSEVGETAGVKLHRGLRQPSLLLALLGVVRDNHTGSAAQRAAGSALVAFCDCSSGLWKELAKEVLTSKALLEGFLEPASSLALIRDHRTQELVFEALYRLWKVWKKQRGGPPALPSSTPSEVKEGLASITIEDFEGQTRAMLASLNSNSRRNKNGGAEHCRDGGDEEEAEEEEEEEEEEGCWVAPPSSFPVEALLQATAWEGLGMSQRLGDGKWVDVNGDNIGIQVCPRASPRKSRGTPSTVGSGVFMSISAEAVKRSSKVLVAKRSLQLDISFSECPSLARLAYVPPGETQGGGRCTLILQLGGGAITFSRFRKAIAALISATPPRGVATKTSKLARGSKTAAATKDEKVKVAEAEKEKSRFNANTNAKTNTKKRPRAACGLASSKDILPPSTRQAAAALVTPLDHSAAAAEAPRRSAGRLPSSAKQAVTDSDTDDVSPATAVKTGVRGRGDGGGGGSAKRLPAGSFRRIAQGSGGGGTKHRRAEGCFGGGRARRSRPSDDGEEKEKDEELEEEEEWEYSWMAPQRCLDLAPAPIASEKKKRQQQQQQQQPPRKARQSREKFNSVQRRPAKRRDAGRTADQGLGLDEAERDASDDGNVDDGNDKVGQNARRPQQATTPKNNKIKNIKQAAKALTRGRAEGSPTSPQQDRPLVGDADSRPGEEGAANLIGGGSSHQPRLSRYKEGEDAGARATAATATSKQQPREAKGALSVNAGTPAPPRAGKKRGAAVAASNHVAEGVAGCTERAGDDKDIPDIFDISDIFDSALSDHSSIGEGGGGVEPPVAVNGSSSSRRGHGGSERKRGTPPPPPPPRRQRQRQQQQQRGAADNAEEGPGRDGRKGDDGGDYGGYHSGRVDEVGEEDCAQGEEHEEMDMEMEIGHGEDGEVVDGDGCGEDDGEGVGEDYIEWEEGEDEGQDQGGGADEDEEEDDDEDHTLVKVTRMFQQVIADAQEKDRQLKKRKVDTALKDARGLSLGYIDQVSQQVTGHWKSLVDDMLESGRKVEADVAAAEEAVAALTVEQEAQWQAARDRVHKYESALKRLEALLGSQSGGASNSTSTSTSELGTEWQAGGAAIQLKLQNHREGAVSRFSAWLSSSRKKAKRSPGGGGAGRNGGGNGDIASLLGHLGGR